MEKKSLDKKKLIIIISAAVAVIAIVVALILILGSKKEAYRNIKVYAINGDAVITREEIGDINAYDNMVLQSGDSIVMKRGRMTLQLDEDKYVYVEEGTEFSLEATGTAENSKTTIYLAKGEITNDIQNKLSADSSYEVNTPNATMSVRGTIFYVNVYEGPDGVLYTKLTVFDGSVETNLVYADGTIADESKLVEVNYDSQVIIYEDTTTTDYLTDVTPIDYDDLPDDIVNLAEALVAERANSNNDSSSGNDGTGEVDTIDNPGPFTVTFLYNGSTFGKQTVSKGDTASEPSLMPEASGHWDFDFSTAVEEDIEVNWISE